MANNFDLLGKVGLGSTEMITILICLHMRAGLRQTKPVGVRVNLLPLVRKGVALEERDWLRVIWLDLDRMSRSPLVLPGILRLLLHLGWALQERVWFVCRGKAVRFLPWVCLFQIKRLVVLHN